jgi:uncharacterized membrane protein YgcG
MRKWLLLLLLPLVSAADERILNFASDVVVLPDGWIEVTETITVRAEGARIQRGIYRDFPTEYKDRYGNSHVVAYQPLAVLRNDAPEDFHSEKRSNGLRTYFGNPNRYLEHGMHTYVYRYRANRMLGFFEQHDELYWNATGNEWAFPIDGTTATVTLAFEGEPTIHSIDAYTGPMGATGKDYSVRREGLAKVLFSVDRTLMPHEGLTVAVGWPKGFVTAPGQLQRAGWLLKDNLNLIIVLIGFASLLAYFIPVWRHFGRDPDPGLVVTRYVPPENFSPASLRFIQQMYYDSKVMTSAILSLAVKGYLQIEQSGKKYTLVKKDAGREPIPLATGEEALYGKLFEGGDRLLLDNEYHERVGGARSAHIQSLKRDYAGRYFKTNVLLSVPGIVIALISSAIALNVGLGPTPFVIGVIVLMVITFFVFAAIMKRPTGLGRKLLDEMLGFREYLEVAEKDEMNLRNPPAKTPQLFERYLPFALAMGVEQKWAEKFTEVLAQLRGPDSSSYHPSWYSGKWNSSNFGSSMSRLSGSLDTAISSSASPPGSSSGGGGGGSSGGGGGGGGGGGW